jgi:hypothetical protein
MITTAQCIPPSLAIKGSPSRGGVYASVAVCQCCDAERPDSSSRRTACEAVPVTFQGFFAVIACGPGRRRCVGSTTNSEPGETVRTEALFAVRGVCGRPCKAARFCIPTSFWEQQAGMK